MKKVSTLVIAVVLLLTFGVAEGIIDPNTGKALEKQNELKTVCEKIRINPEYRDECIVRITQLISIGALAVERFNKSTLFIKFEDTEYWNAWTIKGAELTGVVMAIFTINPKINRALVGIDGVPMFDFTYDGNQLCTTLIMPTE